MENLLGKASGVYVWCIAIGYGLNDRGSGVQFPAGTGNFSPRYRVQTGSGAHAAS
jgi:hypothetical protein